MYLWNNLWKKKDATFNLPIVNGEYSCSRWKEVESTAKEICLYDFPITQLYQNYDLAKKIHQFCLAYSKAWPTPIIHQSIGLLENYMNVMKDDEILKVHQTLVKQLDLDETMRKGIDFEIAKLRGINAIKNPEPS